MDNLLIYIMGANAVGKTSFGKQFLNVTHINLDEIVLENIPQSFIQDFTINASDIKFQEKFLDYFEGAIMEASVQYENKTKGYINEGRNISIEGNTLPKNYSDSKSIINFAINKGYNIDLVFIAHKDKEFLKDRVYRRTETTGQYVSESLFEANFTNGFKDINDVVSGNFKSINFRNIIIYQLEIINNNAVFKPVFVKYNENIVNIEQSFVIEYKDLIPNLIFVYENFKR